MNQELPDIQARLRKGRGTKDKITNIHWIIEKAREFKTHTHTHTHTPTSASLTTLKPLCESLNCGKFLKRWEYQNTLPES